VRCWSYRTINAARSDEARHLALGMCSPVEYRAEQLSLSSRGEAELWEADQAGSEREEAGSPRFLSGNRLPTAAESDR